MISTANGRETCVHIGSHILHTRDSNVCRQYLIQLIRQLTAINGSPFVRNIEMCHHNKCMHSSICATSPYYLYVTAKQCRQTALQYLLHSYTIGLNLPTVIRTTVITEMNKIPHNLCKGTINK